MKQSIVKDLMVPLSEYAIVSEDASLIEAIKVLEKAQREFDQTRDRHRALLIHDRNNPNKVVGKVSQLDVLRALEPKYKEMGEADPLSRIGLSRFGFSQPFLKSLINQYELWDKPFDQICMEAGHKLKVRDFMYTPTEGEYVKAKASLNEATHQLVMGHHQSLLVTEGKNIVGILRLTDIFREISKLMQAERP